MRHGLSSLSLAAALTLGSAPTAWALNDHEAAPPAWHLSQPWSPAAAFVLAQLGGPTSAMALLSGLWGEGAGGLWYLALCPVGHALGHVYAGEPWRGLQGGLMAFPVMAASGVAGYGVGAVMGNWEVQAMSNGAFLGVALSNIGYSTYMGLEAARIVQEKAAVSPMAPSR